MYGIYTLLDAHQDVLSQKFCGEGIPDWAVDTGCKENSRLSVVSSKSCILFTFTVAALRFPVPVDTPFENDPNTLYPLASVSN